MFTVAAFYKFVQLSKETQENIQNQALFLMQNLFVFGTILIAKEGINSTIAGSKEAVNKIIDFLKSIPELSDLTPKLSFAEKCPFSKIKVKIKNEILTFGEENCEPSTAETGIFVKPKDWNGIISNNEVTLIDVRNSYEFEAGTFKNSVDPKTEVFTEFKDFVKTKLDPEKNKKVAMFCTGGIRCEKASSYMIKKGFKEIYQLEGGILKYLEDVPESETMWQGECFIFDDRRSLDQSLQEPEKE